MTVDLISLDPGLVCPAMAYFDHGKLVATRFIVTAEADENRDWLSIANEFWFDRPALDLSDLRLFVYERPKVYTRRKINQNSLLDLTGVAGAVLVRFMSNYTSWKSVERREYLPFQWKGNMEKKACNRLVKSRLAPEELRAVVLPRASLAHNVWDAIGVGLKALNRFGPHTKPRKK